MLRKADFGNPFALPVSPRRLLYPAAAVLLAVLTAVTALGALRCDWRKATADVVLTSGGKFAARVPGAAIASAPVGPSAGQTETLPTLARDSASHLVSLFSTLGANSVVSEGAALTTSIQR